MKLSIAFAFSVLCAFAQQTTAPPRPPAEQAIYDRIRGLRALSDADRPGVTKELALQIRQLPAGGGKYSLASGLANLVTEGDPGRDVLQETATTLAAALREPPVGVGWTEDNWATLAQLVRYEHVEVKVDDPLFRSALAKLEADDQKRQHLDFTLKDLQGKSWTLRQLAGKVVLVNFWATWCPPCRKEMPDLDALYKRFRGKGLVILAISDEDREKVAPFIAAGKFSYPILLDTGRHVNDEFIVQGIPKSFVYDRSGKMVAQSIDMRTQKQFLEMLGRAGLK